MKRVIIFFSILSIWTQAIAQDGFESKEAKKVWGKLNKYFIDYDHQGILDLEDKALSIFEDNQDTTTAAIYNMLAEAYLYEINDPEKALEYYEKDYKLTAKLIPNSEDKAISAKGLAGLYDELGFYEKSEELYLSNLDFFEEKYGDRSYEYFDAALELSIHYQYVGDIDKGIDLLKPILRKVDKSEDLYPLMLNTLANLYFDLGSYKKAEKNFQDAITAFEAIGMYASLENIATLNSLSALYNEIGKINIAESLSLESLDIVNKLEGDNTDILTNLYYSLADHYTVLGNYEKAIEYLMSVVEMDKEYYGTNSFNYVNSLNLLGIAHNLNGDYESAQSNLELALEISRNNEDLIYERPYVMQNLANLNIAIGQYNEALSLLEDAATLNLDLYGENIQYATIQYYLGDAHLKLKDKRKAREFLESSRKIRKKTIGTFHNMYVRSLNKLAILDWTENENNNAKKLFKEIFDIYFKQIEAFFPVLSEEEKANFYYNKIKYTFEQFNSFAIQEMENDPALIGDMYDYQLATKGLILYATNKVRKSILNSGDSVLIDRFNTWISYKEQLSKLFSSTEGDLEIRNKKIDSLSYLSERLEKELGRESADFANVYSKKRISWKDVQKNLKEGEAAIEIVRFRKFNPDSGGYYTRDINYAALIVKPDTKNNPEIAIFKNGRRLENRYLANYRNAIKYQVEESYSYNLFWKPIANKLEGIEKIYFAPDGVYNQVSIYSLRNSETGNYTVDELDIRVVNNTKDLVLRADSDDDDNKLGAEFFGFPNYNMGNLERMIAEQQASEATAEEVATAVSQGRGDERGTRGNERGGVRGATRDVRGGRGVRSGEGSEQLFSSSRGIPRGLRGNIQRYMNGNNLLVLLPGTKKEIETIKELYDKNNYDYNTYMEDAAMESKIKNIKNPSTLHIATHGFFLENQEPEPGEEIDTYVENPLLRAGIILAGANSFLTTGSISDQNENGEDGILTAYEAMNMNLDDTDLVVLSACETGLGEVQNGEGVYGLQRAFQIAGAESVIMSMWTVDDAATQELMTAFYEEWLKTGDKHESFKKAQRIIKDKWVSPYYWGPFVMVGM